MTIRCSLMFCLSNINQQLRKNLYRPEMEQQLEKVLNNINSQPETVGCLVTNRQGLCLGAKGKINPNMSGIGMALSEQMCKLEPNLNPPTIILYSGNKRCVIQKDGEITGIIYKQSSN